MTSTKKLRRCPVCGRRVTAGRAYVAHMRAHVRRGEACEFRGLGRKEYRPTAKVVSGWLLG